MRLVVLAAASLVVGCAQPGVTPEGPSSQPKVGSVEVWQDLAQQQASSLSDRLEKNTRSRPIDLTVDQDDNKPMLRFVGQAGAGLDPRKPIFVEEAASDWPFGQAYRKFLIEALSKRGHPIARSPQNATVLNFDVDTYLYERGAFGRDSNKTLVDYPSFWGSVAAAGFLVEDATLSATEKAGIAAGTGVILQALKQLTDTTNAEAVLTTEIVSEHRVMYTSTERFYVEPQDLPLYWSRLPDREPTPTMPGERTETDVVQIKLTE